MLTEIDALYLESIFSHKSIHGLWRGFPLSRNFYKRMHVSFTRVNKIEAMYGSIARKHKSWTMLNILRLRAAFNTELKRRSNDRKKERNKEKNTNTSTLGLADTLIC